MLTKVTLRELTPEQRQTVAVLAHSRTAPARTVEHARIIAAAAEGLRPTAIARKLGVSRPTISIWIPRFTAQGSAGLEDQPRAGRPATYPPSRSPRSSPPP
jgi:hypothetical protein